jgi:hypothetical protein
LLFRYGSLHRRRCKSSIKASASSPNAQVRYAGFRVAPRRETKPRTRDMHVSIQSASACKILTILRVSEGNISHVEINLKRSGRIHPGSSGRHHLPMEESPTGLSPKSIATSAGRIRSSILYIFISHAYLALYIAASICWNSFCIKAMCGRSLPSYQAYSPPAKRPDCCHNVQCYDASSC